MNDRHFSTFHIAGFTYYDGIDVYRKLKIGEALILKAEPDNKFDPNAIAIYYKTTMLGYVPAEQNELISKFFRLGYIDIFEAKISQKAEDAHPEKQIRVSVRIVPKAD